MDESARDRFQRTDEVFDAVLDVAPNERDAFLDEACGTDHALRARVRVLLEAYDRSSGFLDSPAVEFAAVLLEEPPLTAPEHAGPFRIIRELGHGGMGVVYLAEREGAEFTQRVALKLVRQLGASDAVRRRFVEERRILALLQHPRIAYLIDGGLTSEGLPYFAMELVEGEPIDAYCNANGLSVAQRVDLFIEVCDAVQYAHEHLVIHRDLKPSNILVRGDGQLKLLDFGIAKLLDPLRASDAAGATQTGVIALTPEYAAPEQIRGEPVSTATDTYALGVLLYLLLTGQRPYEVRGRSPAEVERIICDAKPPRPSTVAPEKSRRSLSGDLDLIVMQALNKDPVRRYSSASALRDDLRRYRAGLPIHARPESRAYRLRKFVRRNRSIAAALSMTAIALLGATAFSTLQMREAQRQRDEAVREAERQHALAEVQSVLASDSRDAQGKALTALQRIVLAEQVLRQQFIAKPWLVVEGMAELSERLYEMSDREAQRAMLARARSIAERAGLPSALARVECARAYSLAYDDAVDSARAAIAASHVALSQAGGATELSTAKCVDAEGQVLIAAGKPDSAVPFLRRAVALTEDDRFGSAHQSAMMDLSLALRGIGRTREAAEYQRRVIMERVASGFSGTSIMSNVMTYLVGSLYELGELAQVDSVVRWALAEAERVPGAHTETYLVFTVGQVQLRLGEIDTAAVWLGRAFRDTSEDNGGRSAYYPPTLTQLLIEQGRIAEARRSLPALPSGTLIRRVNRAWLTARVRHGEGDTRASVAMLEDSLRAIRGDAVKPPPSLAMPFVTAAEWRLAAGDARAADSLALLARDAAAIDSLALERSAYVGRAELVRAKAAKSLGDVAAARAIAGRAIVALTSGAGKGNRYTLEARAFGDALSR
jgi:serine/threonine-protein kinase